MKLQGLELEIEGSREDASVMTQNIGQQIAGMLRPIGDIVDGEVSRPTPPPVITLPANGTGKKIGRRRSLSQTASTDTSSGVIDFIHASDKYGNPKQQWKTAQKSIWLLYVLQEIANVGELTARNIADTFNKHFRQAGLIQTGNVGRDLGKLKVNSVPAPIGEDTRQNPSKWFLTDEGRRHAQELVAEALGQSG